MKLEEKYLPKEEFKAKYKKSEGLIEIKSEK